MRRRFLLIAFALFLCVLTKHTASAQGITTSAMNGLVVDMTSEPLIGATVIAVHTPTGTQYGTVTGSDGRFNFQNLRVGGPYTVTVSYVGYAQDQAGNINLALGENRNLTFMLTEDNVTLGEVVVTGRADEVFNAGRTGASTNVGIEKINRLPTLDRSIQDFTRLTPQATGGGSFGGRSNRFNNISIDGAVNNDVFGLAATGTPGGQTNAQPISLDAIGAISVSVAPFDVREGSFTGAGINAVTRSGTNEFSGSVYHFQRTAALVSTRVGETTVVNEDFSDMQSGFRLGGPIIKNKLFFFTNYERASRITPPVNFVAARPGLTGDNVSRVQAADLDRLSDFLIENYNFDPGAYENYRFDQLSHKWFGRIDWNISQSHKLTLRHNFVTAFRDIPVSNSGAQGLRQNSVNALPFQGSNYRMNNTTNSTVMELNSAFGARFANNLILGATTIRDYRSTPTGSAVPFPTVDIEAGDNLTYTTFGYEPFSAFNRLDQDIFQITNNFNIYANNWVFTLGTHNEFYRFVNGFLPRYYGNYRYATLDAFINNQAPSLYEVSFSRLPGGEVPLARFSAAQLGLYAQGEWTARQGLRLTFGLRGDVPIVYNHNSVYNPAVEETFGLRTDQMPAPRLLMSPRIGFNWDVNNDRTTQFRGGTGIFTGRVPFVWISNQVGNNGMTTGNIRLVGNEAGAIRFNPDQPQVGLREDGTPVDPNTNQPIPGVGNTSNIAVTSRNFRFPQVWRTNLAVDQRLPGDFVLTLEGIYGKDLNAIIVQDLNLVEPVGTLEGDGRSVFPTGNRQGTNIPNRLVDGRFTDVILMDNTSRGYQLNLTAQLQKTFRNGLFFSTAYNHNRSTDLNSGTSSIARSNFNGNQVLGNPNDLFLATSAFEMRHRFIASASFFKEYLRNFGTSVSLFYELRSGLPFSYVYGGDPVRSGYQSQQLIYVPRTQDEILLVNSNPNDTRTQQQIWDELNAYIEQDRYLSTRRGQYAERNGARTPWSSQLDVSIRQDFYLMVAGKRNTFQLSFDVFNFGNMLNPNWGIIQQVNNAQILSFVNTVDGTATGRPQFSFNNPAGGATFRNNVGLASRWQAQFGLRYIFN
jgi:hypothetical protein